MLCAAWHILLCSPVFIDRRYFQFLVTYLYFFYNTGFNNFSETATNITCNVLYPLHVSTNVVLPRSRGKGRTRKIRNTSDGLRIVFRQLTQLVFTKSPLRSPSFPFCSILPLYWYYYRQHRTQTHGMIRGHTHFSIVALCNSRLPHLCIRPDCLGRC